MTFFDISLKMFRRNFARYRLYFLCCFLSATVFFCFASLFTNPFFMEGQAVDPMVSENIIFPSFLSAVFLLLFVPYSYAIFLSARKQEYGVLFSLGMSRKMCWKCLLLEGLALGTLALLTSFAAGTLLSVLFYGVVSHIIGISSLQWSVPYKAYAVTAFLYGAALIAAAIFLGLRLMGGRIRTLLLAPYRAERKGRMYRRMKKYFPVYMRKHLLEFSLLARHKREWAIRYVVSALLIGSALYLVSFCAVLHSALMRDVENYCPYDLAYTEIFGQNHISEDERESTLSQYQVIIEEEQQVSFARDNAFNYLSVSEVNEKLGCSYRVPAGKFLNLFQYEAEDGYEHEIVEIPSISLNLESGNLDLYSCGSDTRILFNKSASLADYTLILNDADYRLLRSDCNYWPGTLNLLQLQDWKESHAGISAFQSFLQEANGLSQEEQQYFRAHSKIEYFQVASQSVQFAMFLLCFVEALLLMAAFLLIYSRMMAEQEENKRLQKSLYMIGITESEQYRLLLFKNRMRLLPPLLIALVCSMPVSYRMGEGTYHSGNIGCVIGTFTAIVLLLVAVKFLSYFSKKELLST